jgi:hypothetical protein
MNWERPLGVFLIAIVGTQRDFHIVEPTPRNYIRDARDGNNNNTLIGIVLPPGNNNFGF